MFTFSQKNDIILLDGNDRIFIYYYQHTESEPCKLLTSRYMITDEDFRSSSIFFFCALEHQRSDFFQF